MVDVIQIIINYRDFGDVSWFTVGETALDALIHIQTKDIIKNIIDTNRF